MSYSVGLVGAGPTAIYNLQALLARAPPPETIFVFERARRAGQGTPYSVNWSDPIMLANIASIELPPLPQSLVEWLSGETDMQLAVYGIERAEIDERAFFPRLVIGEYLAAQFLLLVERARSMGLNMVVQTQALVTDVLISGDKIELTVADSRKHAKKHSFDYVILATGHQWPADPEVRPGYFTSPWPASALARIRNCAVGIRGTSLSAIDTCVALAGNHGEFLPTPENDNELTYQAQAGTEAFSVSLFSRKGILPEADFFHQRMRVLCVDNDRAILDGMEALLGQWGVHVLKACNVAKATRFSDRCARWHDIAPGAAANCAIAPAARTGFLGQIVDRKAGGAIWAGP